LIAREYKLLGDHPLSLMRLKSNRVDSIRFRTLTYFTRQVSFLNINMLGKWVMILLQKKNQEFHWKTNLLREVIQTHKRVLRRNRDRTIRINPLVDQEIKITRLLHEEIKILNQDE
jgi:hypothetical protein